MAEKEKSKANENPTTAKQKFCELNANIQKAEHGIKIADEAIAEDHKKMDVFLSNLPLDADKFRPANAHKRMRLDSKRKFTSQLADLQKEKQHKITKNHKVSSVFRIALN